MSIGSAKLILDSKSIDDFLDFIDGLEIGGIRIISVDKSARRFTVQTLSKRYEAQIQINALGRTDIIIDNRLHSFVHKLLVNYYLDLLYHLFDLLDIDVVQENIQNNKCVLKLRIPDDKIQVIQAIAEKLPFVCAKDLSVLKELVGRGVSFRQRRRVEWRRRL